MEKVRIKMFRSASWLLAMMMLFCARTARPVQTSSSASAPLNVGMVALLADPHKYEGKVVRTIGFMCLEYEGNALYLHEEDYRYGILKNAMALRLSPAQQKKFKNLSLKHVIIEGTVDANGPERWEYGGAIDNITRLDIWRPRPDIPAPPAEPPSHCTR
jgi:hypothetical protein